MDMISSPLKTAKNVRNLRAFVKSSLNRQKVKQLNVFRRVVRWDRIFVKVDESRPSKLKNISQPYLLKIEKILNSDRHLQQVLRPPTFIVTELTISFYISAEKRG